MKRNIKYKSKQIQEFYSINRQKWEEYYPSERYVFEKIGSEKRNFGDVLDVGCACGGLGIALSDKFMINSYTGVDINRESIEWANKRRKNDKIVTFIYGDIVDIELEKTYDLVVSLGCADWNIETKRIIDACWERVKPGGYFVVSLRLTPEKGVNDIKVSYQFINFSGDEKNPEVANYVVFNFRDILFMMRGLSPPPKSIGAYGYWGSPSSSAVTTYNKLVFAVLFIKKCDKMNSKQGISTEFNLPLEIYC